MNLEEERKKMNDELDEKFHVSELKKEGEELAALNNAGEDVNSRVDEYIKKINEQIANIENEDKLEAKLTITYIYRTGNMMRREIGELKEEKKEFVGNILSIINDEMILKDIFDDHIIIKTDSPYSLVNENGGINLYSTQTEFPIKLGEEIEISRAVTDGNGIYKIKLESIS